MPSSIPASRKRQPRLTVVSADVITLEVGRKPVTHSFVVKTAGQGRMPGRVTSDRDCLAVTRDGPDAQLRRPAHGPLLKRCRRAA